MEREDVETVCFVSSSGLIPLMEMDCALIGSIFFGPSVLWCVLFRGVQGVVLARVIHSVVTPLVAR